MIKNMELYETVDGMLSKNYKERFRAEYLQTKIRYDKLHQMIVKAEAKTLDFELTCPIELLQDQARAMSNYLYCLELRSEIEKVYIGFDEEPIKEDCEGEN